MQDHKLLRGRTHLQTESGDPTQNLAAECPLWTGSPRSTLALSWVHPGPPTDPPLPVLPLTPTTLSPGGTSLSFVPGARFCPPYACGLVNKDKIALSTQVTHGSLLGFSLPFKVYHDDWLSCTIMEYLSLSVWQRMRKSFTELFHLEMRNLCWVICLGPQKWVRGFWGPGPRSSDSNSWAHTMCGGERNSKAGFCVNGTGARGETFFPFISPRTVLIFYLYYLLIKKNFQWHVTEPCPLVSEHRRESQTLHSDIILLYANYRAFMTLQEDPLLCWTAPAENSVLSHRVLKTIFSELTEICNQSRDTFWLINTHMT